MLAIDHGANLFNVPSRPWPAVLELLLDKGWVAPWREPVAILNGAGELRFSCEQDRLLQGPCFRGRGGMESLCQGLLSLAGGEIKAHFNTLVRDIDRQQDRWLLKNAAGEIIEEADGLVLTGTLLAHPRSQLTFGWPAPPLRLLAERLQDPGLNHALAAIAALRFEARSTLLLRLPAEESGPWEGLPFHLLAFDSSAQQRWGFGDSPGNRCPMESALWWCIPAPPSPPSISVCMEPAQPWLGSWESPRGLKKNNR